MGQAAGGNSVPPVWCCHSAKKCCDGGPDDDPADTVGIRAVLSGDTPKLDDELVNDLWPKNQNSAASTYGYALGFLEGVPLFKRLPKDDRAELARQMKITKYAGNASVIREGDLGDEFFVIYSGKATVSVIAEGGSPKKEGKIVASLQVGDYFGEGALLRDEPRTATITAVEELTTLSVTREKFRELGLHKRLNFPKRQAVHAAAAPADARNTQRLQDALPKPQGPTEKTTEEKSNIISALRANENLNTLVSIDESQIQKLVEVAWKYSVPKEQVLIEEGDIYADHLYVVESGRLDIFVNREVPVSMDKMKSLHPNQSGSEMTPRSTQRLVQQAGRGDSFGELALLHDAPRAATVKATTDSVVWVIDRQNFKFILQQAGQDKIEGYRQVLDRVELLQGLLMTEKQALAEVAVEVSYKLDEVVISKGKIPTTFFILYEGEVNLVEDSQSKKLSSDAETARPFGHHALQKDQAIKETVVVLSKIAKVLAIDRKSIEQLLGSCEHMLGGASVAPADFKKSRIGAGDDAVMSLTKSVQLEALKKRTTQMAGRERISREDLKCIGLLGAGGFARVTLVQHLTSQKTYALKQLSRGYVVQTNTQENVINEKTILQMADSAFIVKLFETYKDEQSLYFLLEPALGGELYATYHRMELHGNESHAKFFASSIVCAFEHLHESCSVIYRDLKPENVLIDQSGYAKLTDMGLAKVVVGQTYTTCGTPDYFAPEMIASAGHNRAVDWWGLGVFTFELMTGHPPFEAGSTMATYRKIRKGIFHVTFPENVTGPCEEFIRALLAKQPGDRLPMRPGGVDNIRSHAWLVDFDWGGLMNQRIAPPVKPEVKSPTDMANFSANEEDTPEQVPISPEAETGWDADF